MNQGFQEALQISKARFYKYYNDARQESKRAYKAAQDSLNEIRKETQAKVDKKGDPENLQKQAD